MIDPGDSQRLEQVNDGKQNHERKGDIEKDFGFNYVCLTAGQKKREKL